MNKKTFGIIKQEIADVKLPETEIVYGDEKKYVNYATGNDYRGRKIETTNYVLDIGVQIGYNNKHRIRFRRTSIIEWTDDYIKIGNDKHSNFIPVDRIITIQYTITPIKTSKIENLEE